MFCPNCGTQNPDAAATCSKCNFHLKSAAAPKFKGTMLMMNQPGALGVTPVAPPVPAAPSGPPAAAALPPPGARPAMSKLKGTMVGVAPMAGGVPPMAFAPTAPSPVAVGSSSAQPPNTPLMGGEGASAYSPPVPQPGVNPLGGTLIAADAGVFGAYAIQQQQGQQPAPPGGAAAAAPYGAPPFGGQPTPQAFGTAPVPGFPGAPPYGAAPPHASGASGGVDPFAQPSPPQQYGQPAAMQPVGQGLGPTYGQEPPGHMLGTLKSEGARVAGPTRRNALVTLLLPAAIMFGGIILSILLALLVTPALGSLGLLFVLGGGVFYLLLAIQMIAELKAVTHNEQLAWWALIVPLYSLVFMWVLVPQEVAKAKQMLGKSPPQPIVLYIFLWPFALASDLNDMVRG